MSEANWKWGRNSGEDRTSKPKIWLWAPIFNTDIKSIHKDLIFSLNTHKSSVNKHRNQIVRTQFVNKLKNVLPDKCYTNDYIYGCKWFRKTNSHRNISNMHIVDNFILTKFNLAWDSSHDTWSQTLSAFRVKPVVPSPTCRW